MGKIVGMVEFTFSKDHGTRKDGEVVVMHNSTASALTSHELGKITKVLKKVTKKGRG